MNLRKLSYNQLILIIIFTSIALSVVGGTIYSLYLKQYAVTELAKDEAKKTSLFVFQCLYTAMKKGATKADLQDVISGLNTIDENLAINVYRSAKVARLFGEEPLAKRIRQSDPDVAEAMKGKVKINVYDSYIRYLYPLRVEKKCIRCHTNMKIGEINGVVDLKYGVKNIKVSLNMLIHSLIVFFSLFMFVVFFFIYVNLKNNIVDPIGNFVLTIKKIMQSKKLSKRIDLETIIVEIQEMEDFFNQMLEALHRQFYIDNLTELPNRRKLLEDTQTSKKCALSIINIDNFSQINNFYGSKIGDLILKKTAEKLKKSVIVSEFKVYRIGGDEFVVAQPECEDMDFFESHISHLLKKLEEPFGVDYIKDISIDVTAGVAYGDQDTIVKADVALKKAKKEKKYYLVYDNSMFVANGYENNIKWTRILREAIEDNRIIAFYQPIINNKTQKIEKYETLVRLVQKDGTIASPSFFMEIAQKSKLYHWITKIVIQKAFDKFKDNDYEFSINISMEDLSNTDTLEFIKKTLQEHNDTAKRVVFELLEYEGIEKNTEVIEFINYVKKFGCKIAIDDFGTGYSNFEYLLALDVDYIKIDATMIKNIDTDKNSEMITETIVEFAKKLHIKTIGEFVHSQKVYEKVKSIGVDYSQGYYLGKPKEDLD